MLFGRMKSMFVLTLFVCTLSGLGFAQTEVRTVHKIREVVLEGAKYTDPQWLFSYLPLHCPCELDDLQIEAIRSKILTTQVFQNVVMQLQTYGPGEERLVIHLLEKWTFIPVVRGAVGGGTPLLVVGAYESHFQGRLLTVGAETRTYGKAPTGGVAWVRAPRWKEGRHYFNLEVWRDNRIRSIYGTRDKELGSVYGSAGAVVAEFLGPVGWNNGSWQFGLRLQYRDQDILRWEERPPEERIPRDLDLTVTKALRPLAKLVYDDLAVAQMNMHGWRLSLAAGPTLSDQRPHGSFEQELFWYGLWDQDWNLGIHEWLAYANDRNYQSLYFLGGFDSIRGIPDGALFGNKAFYTNVELRKILYRAYYTWIQGALYVDHGSAAFDSKDWFESDRMSAGIGLRIAIPQIHRLMLRVDYAWGLDESGSSSISAGLNQFFDPYKPL